MRDPNKDQLVLWIERDLKETLRKLAKKKRMSMTQLTLQMIENSIAKET
jgi:hypothetical protein